VARAAGGPDTKVDVSGRQVEITIGGQHQQVVPRADLSK
jgi:sarcosine oxidase gamma subunit